MTDTVTVNNDAIEDTWSRWEYPTLVAIARWEQGNPTKGTLQRQQVVELVGPDPDEAWKVGRALDRLMKARLIDGQNLLDGTPWPSYVSGLTTAGLRVAGAWPTPASLQSELIARLITSAERIEADQPVKAGKLREVAEVLGGVASDVFAKVIAEVLAKAAGAR